jgi:hypothetical protein
VDRLHVPRGRCQEDLVGARRDVDRLVDLAGAVPLDDEVTGHSRQAAAGQGRRTQLTVDDVEDVGAGALAEVAGEVREHRLGRTALSCASERDHVLAVRRRLQAGERAPLVARPGDGDDRGRLRRLVHRCRDDDRRRAAAAAPRTQRCRSRGDGDPHPAERQVLLGEDGRHPGTYGVHVDPGETEPRSGTLEPVQVPGQRERLSVDDLDRLEDRVADGQAVVGDRYRGGGRVGQQVSVDPGAHVRHPRDTREKPPVLVPVRRSDTVLTAPQPRGKRCRRT